MKVGQALREVVPIEDCEAGPSPTFSRHIPIPMTESADTRLLLVHAPGEGCGLAEAALARAGYDAIVTTDASRTLELCVTERPALVLLDLDVPGSSHEALHAIRHLTEGADSLLVLALTAGATPEIRRWAVSMGVRDFVAKPIDDTELQVRVRNGLEARALHRRLRDRNTVLREAVRERTGEFDTARESLSILAAIADFHDDDTDQHAKRVGIGAALIAQALGLDDGLCRDDPGRSAAARHRQGRYLAADPAQARQADPGRVDAHDAPRRDRGAHSRAGSLARAADGL